MMNGIYGGADRPIGAAPNPNVDPMTGRAPTQTVIRTVTRRHLTYSKPMRDLDYDYDDSSDNPVNVGCGFILVLVVILAMIGGGLRSVSSNDTPSASAPPSHNRVPVAAAAGSDTGPDSTITTSGNYRITDQVRLANMREAPTTTSQIAWDGTAHIPAGTEVFCDAIVEGESIRGNNRWAHCPIGGFIHTSLLEPVTTVR